METYPGQRLFQLLSKFTDAGGGVLFINLLLHNAAHIFDWV